MQQNMPLKIGWVGFHQEGIPALRGVLEAGYPVEGVITLSEEQRAKRSAAVSYEDVCRSYGVPLYEVTHINNPESVDLLKRMAPDVVFVIGWSQIVSPEVLRIPRLGMIGAHASFLPHNRGSAPVNWAIIHGETTTGNSLIQLAEGVDEGDLIDQLEFPITAYDTCASIYAHVAESNREMILRVLSELTAGRHPGRPQARNGEAVLPRRRPQDGAIDWKRSAKEVYNFIRALTRPYPGAFCRLDGETWFIWNSALLPLKGTQAEPGTVLGPVYSPEEAACGQMVACGNGAIVLLEVEKEAGQPLRGMSLSDQPWNGLKFEPYE